MESNLVHINKQLSLIIKGNYQIDQSSEQSKLHKFLTIINKDLPEQLCIQIEKYLKSDPNSILLLPEILHNSKHKFLFNTNISVWKGDITTLKVDAIVNAANDQFLGCFQPEHKCIDNIIHSKAGPRLRMECRNILRNKGFNGKCMITRGYCLPCKYILHVAGPIYTESKNPIDHLEQCYLSCLDMAKRNGITSVAFCCISTGLYGFPKDIAANIAVNSVLSWLNRNYHSIKIIIFNTFTNEDTVIYLSKLNLT